MELDPKGMLGDKHKHNCTNKYVVTNCSKFSKGEAQGAMRVCNGGN